MSYYGQPQNVYQQMGVPQPQGHLNYVQMRPSPIQPLKYSASNPPTSSFPNQQSPHQLQRVQPQPQPPPQPKSRPLPAPVSNPPQAPARPTSRPLPVPGKRTTIDVPSSPPKRRQSPPKFNSNPSSDSSSPIKLSFPSNRDTAKPIATSASITSSFTSSSPPKPPTISPSPSPSSGSASNPNPTTTDAQPVKKPIPVWKRSIPEVPPPVWGYAAGLVADPHPKLSKQPLLPIQIQQSTASVSGPVSPTKSAAIANKLKKKNKATDKARAKDEGKKVYKTKDQANAVYGNAYGLGYASRQGQAQNHSPYLGRPQQQGSYPYSRVSAIINGAAATGYGSRESEDETEEEETQEGTEDETGEEEESDPAPTLSRFGQGNGHTRYHSQPLVDERGINGIGGMHRREQGYHGSDYDCEEEDEDEDTPKKRKSAPRASKAMNSVEKNAVLRPKVKIDPYGGYEDVTPIGANARKKVRPRSEIGDIGNGRAFGSVDSLTGTPRNERVSRCESDAGGFVRKNRGDEETMRPSHRKARSAIEEREILVLNARRNRKRNMNVESDYDEEEEEEVHLAYDNEYEEDVKVNDRRKPGEEEEYRPRSQPNTNSRLVGEGRAPARLPQPPAMVRDRDGGGLISQFERKIRGGPRSAFVHHVSEGEAEEYRGGAGGWPRDLPRLPRTPGGGGGAKPGYFDVTPNEPDLNLDEPPPPPSIMRTPSPGAVGGYVLQKREVESQNRSRSAGFEQARRRFEDSDDVHERAQGQQVRGKVHTSRSGYSSQPMPPHQRQQAHGSHLAQQGRYTATPSLRKQQQTPAPPRPVGIESPYPLGGRDRMADMNKLEGRERDAEDAGGRLQGRRIVDIRNMPKVMVMNDNEDVVSARRDIPMMSVSVEPDRRPLPSPASSHTHIRSRPQSMVITQGFGRLPTKQTSPALSSASIPRNPPHSRSGPIDVKSNSNANSNNDVPAIQVFDIPGVCVSKPDFDDDHNGGGSGGGVMINISEPDDDQEDQNQTPRRRPTQSQPPSHPNTTHPQYNSTPSIIVGTHSAHVGRGGAGGRGLMCGGCHSPITHGRILSAMDLRWHPPCFKCTVCSTLLEHVSSYEHNGKAYCHLDYHETFAPKCYSCETSIIDEQFISLDDPALGKRTYHTQHFFCSECGDPFLDPSISLPTDANGELALSGDGEFEGFTVYKGYPYCEACHVRLRLPKCKRCKKAIRDHEEAVEALGGKWCWGCFVCAGCSNPFEDPSFFQRGNQPYCESCFSIMLRNEI